MNHLHLKRLFYYSVTALIILNPGISSAQRKPSKHADRYDLVANINKIQTDRNKIEHVKVQLNTSKEAKNKKDLQVHREKLKLEKKNLKQDFGFAKNQEADYKKNKAERIRLLEEEMKASNQHYEDIRSQIKSDLAKKNDFALQKHAEELLKAVQERNEASTNLSMEKADMVATVDAMDSAWKKLKQEKNNQQEVLQKPSSGSTLTNK
jgi:hypothetical protein